MLTHLLYALMLFLVATNAISAAYVLAAIWRVKAFRRNQRTDATFSPPLTILKPVCGLEADLYENLRSFCQQDYPVYEVIFGVRDRNDPAVPVLRRLIKDLPHVDISLVIDEHTVGPNLKASNLVNIYKHAKYGFLAIADSDMRVDENYAASVVAPLANSATGVVTCLYSGTPRRGFASRLGSMFINEWFLPSVLVSAALSDIRFGLGATIVVRRELLEEIGGFRKLSAYLADDHMLGKLICAHGYKVALSNYVVENIVHEKSLWALFLHELRWARTIRTVEPVGHAFSFLMYGVPLALFGLLAVDLTIDWKIFGVALVAVAVLLRVWMHFVVRQKLGLTTGLWTLLLVPLRDVLCFVVWAASFFGRRIEWKDIAFDVATDGHMKAVEEIRA